MSGTILARNVFFPGEFNNYSIAGNLCNAFVMGEVGSSDDFFLIGAEPQDESSYPLLTGNILDSEGNVLCRLVRNVLTFNPGDCSKIVGDHIGYEIHDSAGHMVFKVRTTFETPEGADGPSYVTTLAGTFFDAEGRAAFRALGAGETEHLEANAKIAVGFAGNAFGFALGMSDAELEVATHALASRGAIHRVIRGEHSNVDLRLDGSAIIDAHIEGGVIHVHSGYWFMRGTTFKGVEFVFHDEAALVRGLVRYAEFGADPGGEWRSSA